MELPEEPRLRTRDVLVWLYRTKPDRFTVKDIVSEYDISRGEAQRRVNYMRFGWGAVKPVGKIKAHRRGRREIEYALTRWGLQYGAREVKKGKRRK